MHAIPSCLFEYSYSEKRVVSSFSPCSHSSGSCAWASWDGHGGPSRVRSLCAVMYIIHHCHPRKFAASITLVLAVPTSGSPATFGWRVPYLVRHAKPFEHFKRINCRMTVAHSYTSSRPPFEFMKPLLPSK